MDPIGPNMGPWGTPPVIFSLFDILSLYVTYWVPSNRLAYMTWTASYLQCIIQIDEINKQLSGVCNAYYVDILNW